MTSLGRAVSGLGILEIPENIHSAFGDSLFVFSG